MNLNNIYTFSAFSQIPRILTLLDRNPISSTYGCFDRRFHLDKVEDFPNALPQMGAYPLAFCYKFEFEKNIFFKNPLVKDWAISAILWLCKIQHKDGSFDEFYPNERGWAGPTGFILYSVIRTIETLKDEIKKEDLTVLSKMIRKSAYYLAKNREIGTLANHYALALLALYKARNYLREKDLDFYLDKLFKDVVNLFNPEGWFLEYDGVDMGYLTATISFLSRLYQEGFKKEEIFNILKKAIKFSEYFIFPDGSYAGVIGSRGTQHFYLYGFELLSPKLEAAKRIALFMRETIKNENGGIPPSFMADRYFVYRLVEYFDTALVFNYSLKDKENLVFEKENLFKYFEKSEIVVKSTKHYYFVCNLKRGGTFKFTRKKDKKCIADGGINIKLRNNKILTTQWIDENYKICVKENEIFVEGNFHKLSEFYFTLFYFIFFRFLCLFLGLFPKLAEIAKGAFRKILILSSSPSKIKFKRIFRLKDSEIEVEDKIILEGREKPIKVLFGGNFNIRYVPQSRYFEKIDLSSKFLFLSDEEIKKLCKERKYNLRRVIISPKIWTGS